MSLKAELKVIIMANDVVVAESTDPILWQKVFEGINTGSTPSLALTSSDTNIEKPISHVPPSLHINAENNSDAISKLAVELGITKEQVQGALAPSYDEPFLHLDAHCWEALKKNTPPRGPQSVAPIAIAGTVLGLWFKHAGFEGIPNKKQCQAVLRTINTSDKNAGRSLKNTEWLQSRGDGIVINPAEHSRAVSLATAFCLKTSPAS